MALAYAQGLFVILSASMLAAGMANKDWFFGFNNTHGNCNTTSHGLNKTAASPNNIIVGGSDYWHFGFDYTDWALKNGPFFLNDTLVFKYDPPSNTRPPHNVYLLPNLRSFLTCDMKRAKMLANATQGRGDGFKFVLRKWQPHYFACSVGNGVHCSDGLMKFVVTPLPRPWHA